MRLFARSTIAAATVLVALASAGPAGGQSAAVTRQLESQDRALDTLELKVSPSVARYCALSPSSTLAYMRNSLCRYYAAEMRRMRVALDSARMLLATAPTPPPPDTVKPPPVDTVKPPPIDTVAGPPPGGTLFVHPFPPPANGTLLAQFPRDTVSVAVPAPTRTITVVSLQAALDTARAGDRLLIPPNHTTNILRVRPTARASWVTIQGTDSTSRITTTVGGAESSVIVENRAHHVRFLGPLTITQSVASANALFRSGNEARTLEEVPHHIILDGVTIDVGRDREARRCAWPDGAYMAIVNSRLLNCATRSGDAQAILIGNGPGPYRFERNYLEGSHQCIMSGGFDPAIAGLIPSDILFRWNHCFKPLRWRGVSPYPGEQRQVKTVIESKNIRRALFEFNIIENVWPDAQDGYAWLLKSTDQSGGCPWCQSLDITVRYNRTLNAANGFNLAANPQGGVPMTRVSVYDNIIGPFSEGSPNGVPFQFLGPLSDMFIAHNTFATAGRAAMSVDAADKSILRTVLRGNITPNGMYGWKGNATGAGTATITRFFVTPLVESNAVPGAGDCSLYPAGTYCTLPSPLPLVGGRAIGADTSKVRR